MTQQTYTALYGVNMGETAKAIKFHIESVEETPLDPPQTLWFPLSQLSSITTAPAGSGEQDRIKVADWILRQKGLI